MKKTAKPFIKWAGGKTQLLPEIRKYYPFSDEIDTYIEPFVGGGAVLFDILNTYSLNKVYIGDINPKLINTYNVVQKNTDQLINLLSHYQTKYNQLSPENRQKYYENQRNLYNTFKTPLSINEKIECAALMIFLNKTCFNGLYRVNKAGDFNVPHGKYKTPLICDTENLKQCSEKLKNVKIICMDYKQSIDYVDNHTFIYLDPPYRPLSQTSAFTAYTNYKFDDKEQMLLKWFLDDVERKGGKFLLSNSDPKNYDSTDDFFDDLYSDYRITRIKSARAINSNGQNRGKISELLITNM